MNPRSRTRAARIAALLAALALTGAACGGDDDSAAAPAGTASDVDQQQEEPPEPDGAPSDGGAPSADGCPFTAEELGEVTGNRWIQRGPSEDDLDGAPAIVCAWRSEESDADGEPVLLLGTHTLRGDGAAEARAAFLEACEEYEGTVTRSSTHPGAQWCEEAGSVDNGVVDRGDVVVLVGLYVDDEGVLEALLEDILGLV
jgi:hypothetical protein